MKTLQQISSVLYRLDPMGTCCVENELYDEYDDIAKLIVEGHSLKYAFYSRFWKGCLNNEQLKSIKESIDAIV